MDYLHMQIQTSAPRTPLPLDVLVPGHEESNGPFRLALLLHDIAGNNTTWIRHYPVEDIFSGTGTIVVMPSCLNSFYVNMYYGYDMLDYITTELPGLIGKWMCLSEAREDHLIAGIGMGGYGAVRAALAAPEVYGKVLSLDGMLDPALYYDEPIPALRMEDVFGPRDLYLESSNYLLNAVKEGRAAVGTAAGGTDTETDKLPVVTLNRSDGQFTTMEQNLQQAMEQADIPTTLTSESTDVALRRFACSVSISRR